MKFADHADIVKPLKVGEVIYNAYRPDSYYRVIQRYATDVVVHACDEKGRLTHPLWRG